MNFKQDIIAHTFRNKYLKYTGGSYTTSKASSTTDYTATQIANWFYEDDNGNLHSRLSFVGDKEISAYGVGDGSGSGSVTIIDNLLSNATDCALSANQGRVLNEKIQDIIEQGVGGVTSWDELEDKPVLLTDENIQKWNTQTHTHSNKTVLDGITSANITNWNNKLDKSVWDKAFYYDSDNNLRVKVNVVGEKEMSAYGASESGGGAITIIDNLTSTATDCALSANQGRVLKNLIDNIDVGSGLDSVNVTGTGNAVTNASLSNNILTLTKGSTFALSEHIHTKSGYSWTAKYKINNWSRIMTINGYANVLLSINFAQSSQASNHLYLISCGHTSANIIQLGANNYNTNYNVKVRVSGSDATTHNIEVYGTYGYNGATEISIDCNYVKFENISIVTTYNTYTAGGGTSRKEITSSYNKIVADLAGNADSATKLQTSRTLWGNTFNGTQNLSGTISISSTNKLLFSSYGGGWYMTDESFLRSYNEKSVFIGNGSYRNRGGNSYANNITNISEPYNCRYMSETTTNIPQGYIHPFLGWSDSAANGWTNSYVMGSIRNYTNNWGAIYWGIYQYEGGNRSWKAYMELRGHTRQFYVNGSILSEGEITAYSDKRLKSNIQTLEDRGYITPVTYEKDGKQSIGFLAQDVQKLYPELVTEDTNEEKYLSLNYAQYTAVLQAQIIELNNRIKQLESKL